MGAVKITGFKDLDRKLEALKRSFKKREINAKMIKATRMMVAEVKRQAPKSSGYIEINGKRYKRKRRQAGGYKYPGGFRSGLGRRSVSAKVLRKAKEPMVSIGAHSLNAATDGFYMRRFVIGGHNIYKKGYKRPHRKRSASNTAGVRKRVVANPFVGRAFALKRKQLQRKLGIDILDYTKQKIKKVSNA